VNRLLIHASFLSLATIFGAGCGRSSTPPVAQQEQSEQAQRDAAPEKKGALRELQYPISRDLTDAEKEAYGRRAALFIFVKESWGIDPPPLNWRDSLGDWLAEEDAQWSQCFEELCVRDFFHDRKNGFFLDAGCYLPRRDSVTYYLEANLGWKGIGVDVVEAYGPAWAEYRPNSTFISRAVSDTDDEQVTLFIQGTVASLEKELAEQFLEGAHLETDMKEVQVTTITLNKILEQENVQKLDFVNIDIEGVELAALRGFDIQHWKPELCCIATQTPEPIIEYFVLNGYELIEKYRNVDTVNFYFTPAETGTAANN
jgi:FkbM family methyltransferase